MLGPYHCKSFIISDHQASWSKTPDRYSSRTLNITYMVEQLSCTFHLDHLSRTFIRHFSTMGASRADGFTSREMLYTCSVRLDLQHRTRGPAARDIGPGVTEMLDQPAQPRYYDSNSKTRTCVIIGGIPAARTRRQFVWVWQPQSEILAICPVASYCRTIISRSNRPPAANCPVYDD
jgi:hypothetical protein